MGTRYVTSFNNYEKDKIYYIPSHNKPNTKVHCGPGRTGGAKYRLASEET